MKSPLDRAHGSEVIWQQLSPLFDATWRLKNPIFVYFIGEEESGALKIGLAKDPLKRLRGMQTGNPRRLRIEHVLLGSLDTEKLLHEMWESFAIKSARSTAGRTRAPGTEWFRPEIRATLEPIVVTAAANQVAFLHKTAGNISCEDMDRIVREAHIEHNHVVIGRDEDKFLAAGGGYVGPRRSRLGS